MYTADPEGDSVPNQHPEAIEVVVDDVEGFVLLQWKTLGHYTEEIVGFAQRR